MTTRIAFALLLFGAFLRWVAAIIDNDVLGIFRLSYRPHALAARILCAVDYLLSFPALAVLMVVLLVWGIGRMAA